jgi:hypothetical protein
LHAYEAGDVDDVVSDWLEARERRWIQLSKDAPPAPRKQ